MKKYFLYTTVLIIVIMFSGCSLVGSSSSKNIGGVRQSTDAGKTWEIKNRIDEKKNISVADVITVAIDPVESDKIYLGTKNKGLLISEDNAESWRKTDFPAGSNVYSVIIDYFNPEIIYASGVVGGRGKIFKTQDGGESWDEIYTEPAGETYVTSMAMDSRNPRIIFVGTSGGVILKTSNGGESWDNLYQSEKSGAIADIVFGGGEGNIMYFLVYKKGVLVSDDSGNTFREIEDSNEGDDKIFDTSVTYSIETDDAGALYIGTDKGIFKTDDKGSAFEEIDIISSSKEFPIRAIAVNPFNSNEIIYGSAQAIYKSSDGGERWSTSQMDTTKSVSDIKFNNNNINIVFAGFRKF